MMPMYHQHHQQHNLPYGHQQQLGFGSYHMPVLQNNNWLAGHMNGQTMPYFLQPPPFHYPIDMASVTANPSNLIRKNQVHGHSKFPRMPQRRRNPKQTTTGGGGEGRRRQWNTPTPRRLVHFYAGRLE